MPPQWKDRCVKSEKGVDIEICCDALRLASSGKMERLFLLTNDRDFIPLCKTLKDFGVNISLLYLSEFSNPNKLLTDECDSCDLFKSEFLEEIFESRTRQDEENTEEIASSIVDSISGSVVQPVETLQKDFPKKQ